MLLAYNMI